MRVPAGRSFVRDRTLIVTHPVYLDPYSSLYYGNPASPYYYLYVASLSSGQHPQPWQAGRVEHRGVATWVFVFSVIVALIVGVIVGLAAGAERWA